MIGDKSRGQVIAALLIRVLCCRGADYTPLLLKKAMGSEFGAVDGQIGV